MSTNKENERFINPQELRLVELEIAEATREKEITPSSLIKLIAQEQIPEVQIALFRGYQRTADNVFKEKVAKVAEALDTLKVYDRP